MLIDPQQFTVDRTRLTKYWNKYNYKLAIDLENIHYYRTTYSSDMLEREIANRMFFERSYGSSTWRYIEPSVPVGEFDHSAIRAFMRWREALPPGEIDLKITVERHTARVYFNDISLVSSLITGLSGLPNSYTQYYRVDTFPGYMSEVIYHIKPKNKFRVYLTSHRYSDEEFKSVKQFFKDRPQFKPSFSLARMLGRQLIKGRGGYYIWSTLYFDLDDEQDIVVTALAHPELVGSYCRIEQRPVINT